MADQQLMPYKEKFAKKTLPELTRLMESAGLIFLLNEFTVDYATQIERQRTAGTFVILSFLHSIDYTWICDVYSKRSKLCDHCGQPEETGIIQTGIFCIPDSSQSDTTNLLADARSQLFSLSQDNWLDSVHQSCLDAFKSSFGECASIERVIDLLESEENSGRILEAEELFRGNLDSCFGQAYQDSVLEDLLRRTSECDRKSFEPYMEQIR